MTRLRCPRPRVGTGDPPLDLPPERGEERRRRPRAPARRWRRRRDVAVGLAPTIAAVGIRWFGFAMIRSDKVRVAQAAEDGKVTQGTPAAPGSSSAARRRPGGGPADQALGHPV